MPLRFTLRQLEYFVAVGEEGSVAEAAKRAHVSSPSISAAIAQLEAEIGVALFLRRHAQALALTPAGRQLLTEARRVLAAAEGLTTLASDIGGQVAGPLAIGCLKTFAPLILPTLRRGFTAAWPKVRATQYELDHADLMDRLGRGQIDIGLTYDLSVPPEINFRPLVTLHPWVILPPSHPLAGRPELTPEDLAREPMVLLDLPHSGAYFLQVFDQLGTPPVIAERTRDMAVLRSLVANGYGWSLLNMRTASDTAPDGKRLVFVPLRGGPRPLHLGLATARSGAGHTQARGAVTAFADYCRTTIARDGLPGCLPDR